MSLSPLRLEHLNLPARDPIGLARWYADTFGLQADAHRVCSDHVLIAFEQGEPHGRAPEVHFGFRVASGAVLGEWAGKFGAQPVTRNGFTAFRVFDPEGNCLELYCPEGT